MFELDQKVGLELEECRYGVCLVNEDLLTHFSKVVQYFLIDSDDNYQRAVDIPKLLGGSVVQIKTYLDVVTSLRDTMVKRV